MFVDSHCHLHDAAFASDLDIVLQRARAGGVTRMVTIGTSVEASKSAIELAATHPAVWATVGVAPHDAQPFTNATLNALRELAQLPRVVGVGECGLDYHYDTIPRSEQRVVLLQQLSLAAELGMPVVIHNREADDDMLSLLREFAAECRRAGAEPRPLTDGFSRRRTPLGVMHCFSGDPAFAESCTELGFHISLAGPLTYPRPRSLPDVARSLPLESLLIETDAPYLAPQGQRGRRNEPVGVRAVAQKIAELRGVTVETVAEATSHNAAFLFGLDD